MNSSLIGKIEKAVAYAQEKDRVEFQSFAVSFRGKNSSHAVTYDHGTFRCDCDFFPVWSTCSHSMALERMLEGMVVEAPAPVVPVAP